MKPDKSHNHSDNKGEVKRYFNIPYFDLDTDKGIERIIEKGRRSFYREWYKYIKEFE